MRLWPGEPRARPGSKYSLQHGPRHWTGWSHWSRRWCPGGNLLCLSQGYLAADASHVDISNSRG